jgi:hypothetical protein
LAFTGLDINDTFDGPFNVSLGSGGVPTAIESDDGTMWVYVTTSVNGQETIRMGVSGDGVSMIPESSFVTVVDYTISDDFSPTTNVSSPSIIEWPTDWSQ